MSALAGIKAHRILDSRGQWTIEVLAEDDSGNIAMASVPQGKSTGTHEVRVLPVEKAIENIKERIFPAVKGADVLNQEDFDAILIELDGTTLKENMGGNALLAVSIAVARLGARQGNVPLWRYIRDTAEFDAPEAPPRLFANLINGGLHADNGLRFQEYMVIPKATSLTESIDIVKVVYEKLRKALAKSAGPSSTGLGDEGGFAPDFSDDEKPFMVIGDVLAGLNLSDMVDFGIDIAAGTIESSEEELFNTYKQFVERYPLAYIEDPFGEDAFEAFAKLRKSLPDRIRVVGDDLTVTNVSRIKTAHEKESVNAIIIKPNQIGTVMEAIAAVKMAKEWGWHVVASHRSGETNDAFIADFAYGIGADGFKLGAPARGERVQKYNRLLEIEEEDNK